ncbi:MAG: tRNA nucleotidyltransferase [Mariprofundaceae bacterium]
MFNNDLPQTHQWVKQIPPIIYKLCQSIQSNGGKAWLVGGSVRDLCLGIEPHDIDLEVYHLSSQELCHIAEKFGHIETVGKQFGVIKLWSAGIEIDLALPRTERKIGEGHRGFDILAAPQLQPEIACLRRDFTINAMMFDPITNQLMDFHHGFKDLQQCLLRHVSEAFSEDPLRALRAMQFAARMRLTLHHSTANLCMKLLDEIKTLPTSRIWCEWQKWAQSAHPSFGLMALKDSHCLTLYPELEALIDCPQDPRWHPEGSTWLHTLQVCDQAANIAKREKLSKNTTEHLLFAALCHDLGKPLTTITDAAGHIRSPDHSAAGFKPSQSFLKKIAAPKRIASYIHPLVHDHITHLCGQPSDRAVRRLAQRLHPASIELWEMLVESDASGRAPSPASRPAKIWLVKAIALSNHIQKDAPIITGKMLMQHGIKPGKHMKGYLNDAYTAQLDGLFNSQQDAHQWLLSYLQQLHQAQ